MTAYYNEFDPYAAQWLRNLIKAGHIPDGEVDERSITEVQGADLRQFRQCHFFAGIAGWALAARIAGWPDDREIWTGSAPCQPFSVAGKGKAQADDRHLWPHLLRLIRARRPAVFMGEQVAAAVGKDWFDGVRTDMEGIDYTCRGVVIPACAINAPHRRDRLWYVADTHRPGLSQRERITGVLRSLGREPEGQDAPDDAGLDGRDRRFFATDRTLADADLSVEERQPVLGGSAEGAPEGLAARRSRARPGLVADTGMQQRSISERERGDDQGSTERREGDGSVAGRGSDGNVANDDSDGCEPRHEATEPARYWGAAESGGGLDPWGGAEWVFGHDGKARRVEPSIRLLAHGVPTRVGRLRAYGNAIVPQVAAEVIGAYLDCRP